MGGTRLTEHYHSYPKLQIRDVFKFLFQSAFGCEHLVSDENAALDYIRRESEQVPHDDPPKTDQLDGTYSRVHLSWLNHGLTPETLTRIFCASAKTEEGGMARLEAMLQAVHEMISAGTLPLDPAEFAEGLAAWRAMGFPAVHHSAAFREAYSPAYRVVSNRFANFLPLFARLDTMMQSGPVILAIEGGSASGKSTLAAALHTVYGCSIIHMDDFFLRPEQRTPERLSETGGNLDRERFSAEVLPSLSKGEAITYAPFDCSSQSLLPPVTLTPTRLMVVEGAYSLHPAFGRYYDLSVYLEIASEQQRARISNRNSPALAQRFFGEWIPMENHYFEATDIRGRADMVLPVWED